MRSQLTLDSYKNLLYKLTYVRCASGKQNFHFVYEVLPLVLLFYFITHYRASVVSLLLSASLFVMLFNCEITKTDENSVSFS